MLRGAMLQLVASPARMAYSTTFLFSTGSAPGIPRQTGQVWELGEAPNLVEQPQKILVLVRSWTWTSRPMTAWYFIYLLRYQGMNLDPRLQLVPPGRLLKGVGCPEDAFLAEWFADQLHADG